MGRPKPKFVCNDCNTIFNKKPGVQQQKCWNCGSTNTQGVAKKDAPQPGGAKQPIPELPKVEVPAIPKPPTPPKPPTFKVGAPTPGAALTPEALLTQRAKLKKVVRPTKPLPGEKNTGIARGIRVIANSIDATTVMGVRVGILSNMKDYPGYFYQAPRPVDLSRELSLIAQGKVNPAHGNFNTEYRNRGMELPTGLKYRGPRHPLAGTEIDYFEYGWNRTISPAAHWYDETSRNVFSAVGKACQKALEGYWRARGNTVNVDRLIIAETGEVFYTPDHYLTFFRYAPRFRAWYGYISDEKFSGVGAGWDESFYDDPMG